MTKLEILKKEINYHLKVYKGKTRKYGELLNQKELYSALYLLVCIKVKYNGRKEIL